MKTLDDTQFMYTPDCGVVTLGELVICGVCSEPMDEERNVNGPRGFAMAMSGRKSLHDVFWCPNMKEQWHKQVVALREEARRSVSQKLTEIMLAEAEQILIDKKSTKNF